MKSKIGEFIADVRIAPKFADAAQAANSATGDPTGIGGL
jgi:hypothetical protein